MVVLGIQIGGTRLPSGPPPEMPPGVLGHEVDLGNI